MEKKILDALNKTGKPMRSGEIAEIAGLDKSAVEKLIKKLKAEDVIFSPQRCFYDLKKK